MAELQMKRSRIVVIALCAAAFFMPWWRFGLECALGLAILAGFWSDCHGRPVSFRLPGPSFALLGFSLWAGWVTWSSPIPGVGMYGYWYHVGATIVLYLLLVRHVASRRDGMAFLCCLFAGAAVVALYGCRQYFFTGGETVSLWVDTVRFPLLRRRMYSTLGNPNLLGAYLLTVISALAGFIAFCRRVDYRKVGAALLLLFCVVLALTYSRGAWLGALAVVTVAGLVYDRRAFWLLLSVPVFLLLYHGQIAVRFLSLFSGADTSIALRFAFWDSACQMIADYPLQGIGWGAYYLVYPHYDYYMQNADVLIYHAHNMYLTLAAETGLPGLLLYLVAFIGHGRLAWRLYRRGGDSFARALGLGFLLAAVGMGVNGLTDYNFFNRVVALTFWSIGALAAAQERRLKHMPDAGAISREE